MKHPLFKIIWMAFAFLIWACVEEKVVDQPTIKDEPFIPVTKYSMLVNNLFTEHYEIKKNQQFLDWLHGYKISNQAWLQLNQLTKKDFDFRRVMVGQAYCLIVNPDSICSLKALALELNPAEYFLFHFDEDTLRLEHCTKSILTAERTLTGVIENNLSETISTQGISHTLTNKFVDVMGWQIDFHHLVKGDSFKIVFEEKSVDDKRYSIGEISAAYFKHNGKDFWAVPFSQENGTDYFDLDGNSIRRAFLKYPIEFTHISSRYSLNRFHPVLKVNRPHLGTDLSAATGTPIRSVGDGIVIEAGYNSGSGNYVKVRHNDTYTTGYLHMSRFAAGIKRGTQVNQAQVIGYVGSTGWATGPHLCYRFWKNGIQVDALRVNIPPAKPVQKDKWENYTCAMKEALAKLNADLPFQKLEVAIR